MRRKSGSPGKRKKGKAGGRGLLRSKEKEGSRCRDLVRAKAGTLKSDIKKKILAYRRRRLAPMLPGKVSEAGKEKNLTQKGP